VSRPDGTGPLHVEVTGLERGGEPETFVLLHGFGATSYTWRHWLPALQRRGRVAAVDLKGFGASDKPDDGRYAPSDQVALVRRWIAEAGPGPITLIGHSYGGGLALFTALEMSQQGDARLRRLVIVAGAAYRQRMPPFVTLSRRRMLASACVRLLGPERVIRVAMRAIVYDRRSIGEDQVRVYSATLKTREGLRAAMDVAQSIVPEDLDARVSSYPVVGVPTLLLWGDSDRVVPLWVGRRLAEDLPHAHLEVIERCGHVPHEERADASVMVLEDFLDRP